MAASSLPLSKIIFGIRPPCRLDPPVRGAFQKAISGTTLGTHHRCCITLPYPGVFDDRPPFLGVGLHERAERRPQIGAAGCLAMLMVPQSPQCLPPKRKCSWVLGNME